ncbi:MAG TPA: hypothetical protein PKL92_09215 [Aquaticitalea sp.]|nr:hypothetical protein [Aquaticitalea sp.]
MGHKLTGADVLYAYRTVLLNLFGSLLQLLKSASKRVQGKRTDGLRFKAQTQAYSILS